MIFNNKVDVFEENKRLREENKFLKQQIKKLKEKNAELERRINELEKKLNQLLNINTPSSAVPLFMRPTFTSPSRPPKGTNPRGKPKGSNGATKEIPTKFDRRVKVRVKRKCPECGRRLKNICSFIWPVYEIPKIKVAVTGFEVEEGDCEHCGLTIRGTHPELPASGMTGANLKAFVTELKHGFAGSYKRISNFLDDLTGTTFSPQGLKDCVHRVADQLEPSYNQLESEIRNSKAVGSDETSWPMDGKKWWLWLLTSLNVVLLTINKSRGRNVITGILGNEFEGVITSDCLNVYQKFAEAFQRCWSHLLRRTHSYAEKYPRRDIKKLHEQLSNLYDEVSEFLDKDPPAEQRLWHSIMYHQRMQRITDHKWRSKEAKEIVKNYLEKHKGQWLVGVIMPEVELTNNKTERGIRKVIPSRKLLGGHRTEQGAKDFAIIETHRQTWKLRGESPYLKMVEYLGQQNVAA